MDTNRMHGLCKRWVTVWLGLVIAMLVLFSGAARAQFRVSSPKDTTVLTGNLVTDLVRAELSDGVQQSTQKKTKPARLSPLRAALFSAVIPGAGQAYAKSYWQAAGFLAVEVVGWFVYAKNHSNGNQRESDFQAYADANWSVVRYVDWMRTFYGGAVPGLSTDLIYSADVTARPWDRVNWSLLNTYEVKIAALGVNGFTHTLPPRPNQQYFEEIGKYPQFGGGWDDATSFTPADVLTMNVSPHFLQYRDMRGEANQFYNNATAASYVLVANHIFSALEAAWNASRYNHRIALQGSLVPVARGDAWVELVPTAKLAIGL